MGTWGVGLFSDDLACDMRDDFREHIGNGLTAEEATDHLLTTYGLSLDTGPDESDAALWIALAFTQWKVGRLLDPVRDRAIRAIDAGADLDRWAEDDPKALAGRSKVIAAAREQLLSPQRSPVRIRKAVRSTTPFAPGDVIVYRHPSGHEFVLWVSQNTSDRDGTYSIVEVLNTTPESLPPLADLHDQLPPHNSGLGPIHGSDGMLLIGCQWIDDDRWHRVGHVERPDVRASPVALAVDAGSNGTEILSHTIDSALADLLARRNDSTTD